MKPVVSLSAVLACLYLLSAAEAAPKPSSLAQKMHDSATAKLNKLRGTNNNNNNNNNNNGNTHTKQRRSVRNQFLRKEAKVAFHGKTHAAVQTGSHVFRENAIALSPSPSAALSTQETTSETHTHTIAAKKTPFAVKRRDLKVLGKAHSTARHAVIFAVRQRHLDALEETLYEISDPRSAHYGAHLSREEVLSLTRNDEAVRALKSYLAETHPDAKIVRETHGGEYITVEMSVSDLETLFATDFYEFELQTKEKKTHKLLRAASYALPQALHAHVDHVFNTVQFPAPNAIKPHSAQSLKTANKAKNAKNAKAAPEPPIEGEDVTPWVLSEVYGIANNTGNALTSQAIYATIGESMSPSDLRIFQETMNITAQPIANAIGGHVYDNACDGGGENCLESNLDVQYIMGVAQNVPTTYHYWAGEDFVLDWITSVVNSPDAPQDVYSISYGADEGYFSLSYAEAFNNEAMKLGAMGTTIVVAAGDDGALSPSVREGLEYCGYNPSFPATSPYVISVGATMGPETDPAHPEVLCTPAAGSLISGGGGFSSIYLRPSWQDELVEPYLDYIVRYNMAAPGFSQMGRAHPDVSLLGHSYYVIAGGEKVQLDGTSASAPAFGGMVSLLNARRREISLSKMGWMNPLLYSYSKNYAKDVTAGYSNCAAASGYDAETMQYTANCCAQGFPATAGWDAATGIGSVNFTMMLATATNTSAFVLDWDIDVDSNYLTAGEMSGIVIGAVFGFIAMALLSYCVFFKLTKGPLVAQELHN